MIGIPTCKARTIPTSGPLQVFPIGSIVDFSGVVSARSGIRVDWYGAWLDPANALDDASKAWFTMRDNVVDIMSVEVRCITSSTIPGMSSTHFAAYSKGSLENMDSRAADTGSWPPGLYRIGNEDDGFYRFIVVAAQDRDRGIVPTKSLGAYFSARPLTTSPMILRASISTTFGNQMSEFNPLVPLPAGTRVKIVKTMAGASNRRPLSITTDPTKPTSVYEAKGFKTIADMGVNDRNIAWENGIPTLYLDVTNFEPGTYLDLWYMDGTDGFLISNSFEVGEPVTGVGLGQPLRWVQPTLWPASISIGSPRWHIGCPIEPRGDAQCSPGDARELDRLECLMMGSVVQSTDERQLVLEEYTERRLTLSSNHPALQNTAPPSDFDQNLDILEDGTMPVYFVHFDRRARGIRWTTLDPGWWGHDDPTWLGRYLVNLIVYDPMAFSMYPPPEPWLQPTAPVYRVTVNLTRSEGDYSGQPPWALGSGCPSTTPVSIPSLSDVKAAKSMGGLPRIWSK